ncbi:MAG: GNAT family N-acetyltransferase [Caulobacterales bacterium]|jgi:GNAT superfamily N-acetyltransferase|nr:GNAT family N-acetyltransferase [Caulobacterales bacterium]
MNAANLERACIAAWPARHADEINGWRLFATDGKSWRVNSTWPLEWRGVDVEAALHAAETWAAAHGIAPAFKLADGAIHPADLAALLTAHGYAPQMETLVMTRALDAPPAPSRTIAISATPSEAFWAPMRASAPSPEDFAERQDIVLRTQERSAFAVADTAAVGLGRLTGDLVGIYLMRTAPGARRQGYARDIVRTLCAWGKTHGAKTAYLQVEVSNGPAVALYANEGFARAYAYHYWLKA